jgi:hypothetical protein
MSETGKCEKCASEISVEAERCPECGYEPASHGWISSILVTLSIGASLLLGGLIVIIWLVAFAGTLSITNALIATAFFGAVLIPPLIVIYLAIKKEEKSPTSQNKG